MNGLTDGAVSQEPKTSRANAIIKVEFQTRGPWTLPRVTLWRAVLGCCMANESIKEY